MGGSWDGNENKIIPDVYQRYSSQSSLVMQPSTRGIVTIAKDLSWGPVGVVQTIDAGEDMTPYTGYDATDASNRWVQEMLKGTNRTSAPYRILLYRLNGTGGVKATATTGQLTATAKYPGTRGNDITIVVTDLTEPEDSFQVSTVVDGRIVDSQIIETINQLVANDWVSFSGTGAPTATVGAPLSGGVNPTSEASDWSDYTEVIEAYRFDAMVYDGTDATVRTALLNFIRRYFDDNGRQAQLVASGLTNPDSRWVVNVMSGVVLSDGTTLTPQQVCWWAGGVLAGAQYNQDLTGASYPDAVQVTPKLKRSDLEAGIQAGQWLLADDGEGRVTVVYDINSLTTYTKDITEPYHLNRTMRVAMVSGNDVNDVFGRQFKGAEDNNDTGRMNLKATLVDYLLTMQDNRGIQNFDGKTDVQVYQGAKIDSVRVDAILWPVGSTNFIYVTWYING